MSLEEQYDAWVRGLMGGGKYASDPQQAGKAQEVIQQMQAQLDALGDAQKRRKAAASAQGAVQKAGQQTADHVRKMSSELTRSLQQDGLLEQDRSPARPPVQNADFTGVADAVKARVLGQDAFITAVVKAFRRPFVLGTADSARTRGLMLLCGAEGTGRHYTLDCVVRELAGRGILRSAAIETMDLSLYPGPAQGKAVLAGPLRRAALRRRGAGLRPL